MAESAMQWSGAGMVMVDTPEVDESKHKKLFLHDLACILSPTCSYQAVLISESCEHLVVAAIKSKGACDPYNLQYGN